MGDDLTKNNIFTITKIRRNGKFILIDLIIRLLLIPSLISTPLKNHWLLFLLILLDLGYTVSTDNTVFAQESSGNTSIETRNRLDTIIHLLEESRQRNIIQLNLTIIVFMMGLAFVVFGLYIGQEQKLSLFTKRLYLIAYFALIVPITVILMRYIVSTLLSGKLDDPVLNVAFLLLIPVTASYVLMIVKTRHDVIGRS
jgi:putative copper export protein